MKRLVMTSTPTQTRIDPSFCDHSNARDIFPVDDPGGAVYVCPDCGAWLDEDFEVMFTRDNEIEF